jgi:Zn-dependent protease with chaperone function
VKRTRLADFFTRQEQSRRTTRILVAMFVLAVLATALAVTVAGALVLAAYTSQSELPFAGAQSWSMWAGLHIRVLLAIAGCTLGFIAVASAYRLASLARGGAEVARMLGAREVATQSTDPLERRLNNVVEEIAIASGLPVPAVFVLEREAAINAFAAGLKPADAAITVTRGALERLNRAELQGVIAHEFSHVLNGDMRLNAQLMGLAFGILALSLIGRWLLRTQRYMRRRGNGALLVFGVALTVIGFVGLLSSRLIKAAVSRQRESLADASAVQFTRDPSGLAGALKKIGGYTGQLSSVDSEEVAHMLFARGASAFSGLFATHPPLIERIHALDPSFNEADYPPPTTSLAAGTAGQEHGAAGLAAAAPAPSAEELLTRVGGMQPSELGSALLGALPEELYYAARNREASVLLALALALGAPDAARARKSALLEQQIGVQRANQCRRLRAELDTLDERLHLPLLELAIPALRQRPHEELQYVLTLSRRLVGLEAGTERLFDHLLLRLLATYLRDAEHASLDVAHTPRLGTKRAISALLENVAAFGHEDPAAARAAFSAGLATLGEAGASIEVQRFEPLSEARNLARLDAALASLTHLRPRAKRRVLAAVLASIRQDQRVELAEQELFRVIAATLECPLPPGALLSADGGL